jgi:hypothetical protein
MAAINRLVRTAICLNLVVSNVGRALPAKDGVRGAPH